MELFRAQDVVQWAIERQYRVYNLNIIWSIDRNLKGTCRRTIDIISVEETVQHQPLSYCKVTAAMPLAALGHNRDTREYRIGIKYGQQIWT